MAETESILDELKKQTALLERQVAAIKSWQLQDKHYHTRQERILSIRKK